MRTRIYIFALVLSLIVPITALRAQSSKENKNSKEERGENAIHITQGPNVSNVTSNSATITWGTNGNAANELRYSKDGKSWKSAYEPGGSRNHSVTLSGLEPGQNYTFKIMTNEQETRTTGQFQTLAGSAASTSSNPSGTWNNSTNSTAASSTAASGARAPLYRFSNAAGDHFMTSNQSEATAGGYRLEGAVGYLASSPVSGAVPFYHLASPQGAHLYTTNASERDQAARGGYRDEGVIGYVASSQLPGTTPLYRLSRASNGDHLYTTSAQERQSALQNGYRDEGVAGYIWTTQQ